MQVIVCWCSCCSIWQVLVGLAVSAPMVYVCGAKGHSAELAQLLRDNATHQIPQLLHAGWDIRVIAIEREMVGVWSACCVRGMRCLGGAEFCILCQSCPAQFQNQQHEQRAFHGVGSPLGVEGRVADYMVIHI